MPQPAILAWLLRRTWLGRLGTLSDARRPLG
jgi:hypothetical protein